MVRKVAGVLIAGLLLAVSVETVVAQATAKSSCIDIGEGATRIAQMTNTARADAGLGPVSLDPQLTRVAGKHSRVMAKHRRLFHTKKEVLAWRVTRWNALGENVGVGHGLKSLQRAFMASPSHRANILRGSWVHLGAAVRRAGGRVWVTVVFESTRDPGTRVWMPDCSR